MTNSATGTLCLLHCCLHFFTSTHCTSSEPISSLIGYQMVISPSLNMQCPFWGQWCTCRPLPHLTDWLTTYTFSLYSLCWTVLFALWTLNEGSVFLHNINSRPPISVMPRLRRPKVSVSHKTTSLLLFLIHQTPTPLSISFSVPFSPFYFLPS